MANLFDSLHSISSEVYQPTIQTSSYFPFPACAHTPPLVDELLAGDFGSYEASPNHNVCLESHHKHHLKFLKHLQRSQAVWLHWVPDNLPYEREISQFHRLQIPMKAQKFFVGQDHVGWAQANLCANRAWKGD